MPTHETYRCPDCQAPLYTLPVQLECSGCGRTYPVEEGLADFSGGIYYDSFPGEQQLEAAAVAGLAQEFAGTRQRIALYYLPRLSALPTRSGRLRILDAGCGNGLSVDLLRGGGFDAWGVDPSALRRWQWRERDSREYLATAPGDHLPFPSSFFDAILCSGVIEHVGVTETGGGTYSVTPLPDRDVRRRAFLAELVRVLAPGGTVFLDWPNGGFPIDFWHGVVGGAARWHRRDEGFLPTYYEVEKLVAAIDRSLVCRPEPPAGRLQFQQVRSHWYGRVFSPPMKLLTSAMTLWPRLARSPLNPYLVMRITAPPLRS